MTAIGGPNAVKCFCSNTVLLSECHLWSKYMVSDYDGRRSKRAWPNCVLCIPFMFSGIPNECWLHTWDTCNNNLEIRIMGSSWRMHNLVIHVAQNRTKYLNNQLYKNTSESIDHRNEVIKKISIFSNSKWGKQAFSYKILKTLRCFANLWVTTVRVSNDDGNRQVKCHC